ncbi:small nuclear ribonucleoprotein [Salinarchaeum chitinilyticum]
MSGRPLDVLEAAVGDDVEVHLKSGEIYRGTLAGYDQHMNLVLDAVETSPTGEDGDAESSGGEDDDSDGGDAGAESADADEVAGNGRDTTIIRGDNVVSITP